MILAQQQQILAQIPQPSQPAGPSIGEDLLTDEERDRLADAYLDKNKSAIQEIEGRKEKRRMARYQQANQQDMTQQQAAQARANSFQSYLTSVAPEISKPDSPIAKEISTRYFQLTNDPNTLWSRGDAVRAPDGTLFYPTLMALAATEVRSGHRKARQTAADEAIDVEEPNVEVATRAVQKSNGSFNPKKHLTDSERAMVDTIREKQDATYSYDRFWKRLPEAEKQRRLRGR
jgi:hypothetical protein